jgi:hypothetical protein
MSHLNRRTAALFVALALVFAALVAPAAAPAKGEVSFTLKGALHLVGGPSSGGGTLGGKVSGAVGNTKVTKAEVTGAVKPPKLNAVFHLPGGSLVIKSTDGHIIKGVVYGSYKVTGTGKYGNAKGTGKFNASVVDFNYTFKGTVTL